MNIHDYLIDQSGTDWSELLSGWSAILPSSFTLWLVNRFGDAFAIFDDGSVNMLDVGNGVIERLADSRDEFSAEIDVANHANNWLMIPLVDRCVANGLILTRGQCYGYKIPPILGGEYALENVTPVNLHEHYLFLADIFDQTRDLPDGTRVKINVVNRQQS
jgi:hypothetical protein